MVDSRPTSKSRLVTGGAVVFALSCGVFYLTTQVIHQAPAWRTFEFCQYAEVGRNLAVEGAFETNLVEPLALAYIDQHQVSEPGARWPVINRYPLPCYVVAGLMTVMGATDAAAAWSNGLAISLLAATTYVVVSRWFGGRWGAIAALLFLTNPSFYGYFVLMGTPDVWFALIFLLELLVWTRLCAEESCTWRWSALFGFLAGLAYLTRFNALVFVAFQMLWLLVRRRFGDFAVIAGVLLAVTAPLTLYNLRHFGVPVVSVYSSWNLADDAGITPVEPWLYYRTLEPAELVWNHYPGILRKTARNLFTVVPIRVWTLWHFYLMIPAAILGWVLTRDDRLKPLLVSAGVLFFLQLVVFSGLRLELEHRTSPNHGRYFFWFAVPLLLSAVSFLRAAWERSTAGGVFAIIVVLCQLGFFLHTWSEWALSNRSASRIGIDAVQAMLPKVVGPNEMLASNQPATLLWRAGLKSISLPADPAEIERLNRSSRQPIDYIFVNTHFNCIDLDEHWWRMVTDPNQVPMSWNVALAQNYAFVLPPMLTRPIGYILLRRNGLPPSEAEIRMNRHAWDEDQTAKGRAKPEAAND